MKKLICAAVTASTLMTLSVEERADSQQLFTEAANIPTEACAAEIASKNLDVSKVVEQEVALATLMHPATPSSNDKKVEGVDLSNHPDFFDYAGEHATLRQRIHMPVSGRIYEVFSDHEWRLRPIADMLIQKSLNEPQPYTTLQGLAYDCYEKVLFEDKALRGEVTPLYILGDGNLCLAGRKKIASRQSGHCTAAGRYYSDTGKIVITPGSKDPEASASVIFAHEYMHDLQDRLSVSSDLSVMRELSAHIFDEGAEAVLGTMDEKPVVLLGSSACDGMAILVKPC